MRLFLSILVSVLSTLTSISQTFSKTFISDDESSSSISQIFEYDSRLFSSINRKCDIENYCLNIFKSTLNGDSISNTKIVSATSFVNNVAVKNDTIYYCADDFDVLDSCFYWIYGCTDLNGNILLEKRFKTLHISNVALGSFGYLYPNSYGLTLVNSNEVIIWGEGLDKRMPSPSPIPYRSVFMRLKRDGTQLSDLFWHEMNDRSNRRLADAVTDTDGNMAFHYEWNELSGYKRGVFKILPNDSIVNIATIDVVSPGSGEFPKLAIDGNGNFFINTNKDEALPQYGQASWNFEYISKVDRSGSELWRKLIPPLNYYKIDDFTSDFVIKRINTALNGDVIVCGKLLVYDSFYVSPNHKLVKSGGTTSFIARFDTEGNLLWRYVIVANKKTGEVLYNEINDIKELPDGTIVTGGYMQRDTTKRINDAWMMRVLPNGCMDASCSHVQKYWRLPGDPLLSGTKESSGNIDRLVISPNPTSSELTIQLADEEYPFTYEIIGMSGQRLQVGVQSRNNPIDIAHLPSGLYLVKVRDNKGKIGVSKVVKE